MPSQSAHKPPHPPTLSSTAIFPNAAFLSSAERTATHHIHQNVPMLPAMTGNITTSPPSDRAHSRSISHPFPAPFGKRRNQPASHPEFLDSDDDDDGELQMPHIPDLLSSSPRKGSSRPVPGGEVNSTGKCMTCNSTVRWPRGLKVFRCTECLTVNDLEPYTSSDVKAGTAGKPGASIPRKAIPLSVERTKSIIDGCISTYLRRILDAPVPRKLEARNGGNPSIARQDENRSYMKSQSPGLLSAPRVDARARSSSASGRPGRPEWLHGTSNHLKPISNPLAPIGDRTDSRTRSRNNSDVQARPKVNPLPRDAGRPSEPERSDQSSHPYIFKPLEEYIISSFKGCACLNASFTTTQPPPPTSVSNVSSVPKPTTDTNDFPSHAHPSVEPDAKTLLIGDLGENSSWWMNDDEMAQASSHGQPKGKPATTSSRAVTSRSPRINWSEVTQWYHLILTAGTSWIEPWSAMNPPDEPTEEAYHRCKRWETANLSMIEKDFAEARLHLHRTLLKVTENLLKRPQRPLQKPEDVRFLLILLANPLIYPSSMSMGSVYTASPAVRSDRRPSHPKDSDGRLAPRDVKPPRKEHSGPPAARGGVPNHHFGIIKRIVGLIAHLPNSCHHYLVSWFSRFSTGQFEKSVDLVGSFVTYRLGRQHGRKRSEVVENDNSLVPSFNSAAGNTPAELHAAINGRSSGKPAKDSRETPVVYGDDWQIRAAARLMSLLFTANITHVARKPDAGLGQEAGSANRGVATRRGHKIPISSFYNTLLDYSDLVADFEAWESKTTKFSFCQYPYFLSIWAKIHIMEHDARRQMEVKAREAFFNSILSRKAVSQYLVLKVRRDCLVDDSLRSVSEVVGSSQEEIKKGLRIEFVGEEGVDAGGLRKEWFLLLVREIFDPHHGLFLYDEDSQFCYFNPFCFESSEQFFLVGVLLGLAIYNSTILDIALPPFAFKKLLAAAPASSGPQPATSSRSNFKCTLDDLAEYRPALAKGLRGLLDFDGDVAETFCYDFVAHVDRYGEIVAVPLCPEGEKRPVTNANRREFVDLYVHYMLDTAVTRQFEPFKRGFFTVCGGNALSLFRPEEIELLVRGSDEPLDVASLRAVATYDNWSHPRPENVPVVRWFWGFFEQADPQTQRKILSFITGSDRIPAMGATSLTIRVACLGDDTSRYPIARTCFNTLGLYRYATKATLERMLWEAVGNSEGFGLK